MLSIEAVGLVVVNGELPRVTIVKLIDEFPEEKIPASGFYAVKREEDDRPCGGGISSG